nr:hypothetical protein [Tanacetum cinerariifolium]
DNDGDDFVHPKLSTHDEEAKDEENFDPFVQTPSEVENSDDESNDDASHGMNSGGEEGPDAEDDDEELYRDVNINLKDRGPREEEKEKSQSQQVLQRKKHPRPLVSLLASESAPTEEPMQTTQDLEEPSHQEFETGAIDDQNIAEISDLAEQADSRTSFNELIDTHVDFSAFLMNRLKVDTLTPELLAGPTYELMKGLCKSLVELEFFLKEVYKATTDHQKYITSVTKTKAADYGHIKWIEDLFYGFTVNKESARDVYSKHRIIAVTELQIVEWHDYKYLDWITIRSDDDKLYKFEEGDFKRLCIQDTEDMLLLLVQGKLTNLTVKERFAFNNKDKRNRLMRIDKLHKFSDGTLTDVRTALDDRLKWIQMQYLPQSIWRKSDKDRAAAMIQAIDKRLKTRRIMRSLERFVGGRLYEGDFRMLQRTILFIVCCSYLSRGQSLRIYRKLKDGGEGGLTGGLHGSVVSNVNVLSKVMAKNSVSNNKSGLSHSISVYMCFLSPEPILLIVEGTILRIRNENFDHLGSTSRQNNGGNYGTIMSKTQTDYGSGIARPKIKDKDNMQDVVLFYNGLDVPTRHILDSREAIPSKITADAKVTIQEMTKYSQKWHNGTLRTRSTKTSDGLAAIQVQLNNLGREIKKVNEKVYAAQVGCEQCKGPHYTKDCPLKEEGKTLEEAYYKQYTLSKFMSESEKRHEENSNLIKEIRASTDAAIRNQRASIKTLEIQIGQMSKVLQKRGFRCLPSSTETNLRDHVKSISTIVEADLYLIRRMGSSEYVESTGQNRTLMYETKQTTIPFLSCLNSYYCKEKKLRRDQVEDLMPTIEEGEVVEEFRARNDARMDLTERKEIDDVGGESTIWKFQSVGVLKPKMAVQYESCS